jgi:hypothetical protein
MGTVFFLQSGFSYKELFFEGGKNAFMGKVKKKKFVLKLMCDRSIIRYSSSSK